MPNLNPKFSIMIGSFNSTSENPVGGPVRLVIERDMRIPVDAMELLLTDRKGIGVGDDVAVELGADNQKDKVFAGEVSEVLPEIGSGAAGVRVRALGMLNGLLNYRKAATYDNQQAGDIVHNLIGAAGLTAGTISSGPMLPSFAIDERASAYAHVKHIADLLGYELYADRDGKVMFHALGAAAALDSAAGGLLGAAAAAASVLLGGGASLGYAFGKHLIAASAVQAAKPLASVKVGGESPMSGRGDNTGYWLTSREADYSGRDGSGEPHRLVLEYSARTKDLADRFAKGLAAVAARDAHQVSATVLGRSSIDLGDDIGVSGTPDRAASARGYIRAIRHRFGHPYGFLTDLTILPGSG
jgi:hypothetical protein